MGMTRKEWLREHFRYGRYLRQLPPDTSTGLVLAWIRALKKNAMPSTRPWALTSEEKLALGMQRARFAALLAKLPSPKLTA